MLKSRRVCCLLLAVTLFMTFFVTGCGSKEEKKDADKAVDNTVQQTAQNESGNEEGSKEEVTFKELDLSLFAGGWGSQWDEILAEFKKKYPEVEVKTDFDPKSFERLRARIIAGNPPDVSYVGTEFDFFGAIAAGQYRDLNDLFDDTVEGKDIKYKDLFNSDALNAVTYDGKIMAAPFDTGYAGLFYNKKLFKDKGWEAPKNWDEFMTLCGKIKEAGIAPLGYAGIYADYMIWAYLDQAIAAFGGRQAYINAKFAVKDGWYQDSVKKALNTIAELRDKGYFLKGTTALNHTQVQMEMINGKVAFIPCGSWLENEMESSLPEDFEIGFIPLPILDSQGKYVVGTFGNYFGIPAKAKNYEAAKAWIKFCYSEVGQKIMTAHAAIPKLKDISPDAMANLPKSVQKIAKICTADNITYTEDLSGLFYPTLNKTLSDKITMLVLGEITVDKICEDMENECERIRNDSSIPKRTIN